MSEQPYHIPALLEPTLNGLNIKPDGTYVDVTFGGGGLSRAIMSRLGDGGRLLSFDQDSDAIANAIDDPRFTFVYGNFRFLRNFLRFYGADHVDGILADLGVSFHHFDDPDRGFSFRFDGPLDMRMNQRADHTAAWLLNNASEDELGRLFTLYGELRQGRRLARAIVKERATSPVDTVERLTALAAPFIDRRREKKELAQAFQALRIEVNHEIDALQAFLQQSLEVLKPGGRLAIITYHSLEDRLVKNFMRTGNLEGEVRQDFYGRNLSPLKLLTTRPVVPDDDEIERNPRSRSAKLRIAEKLASIHPNDKS